MPLSVSVVVCTHNPRPDYFQKVLTSLADQTLPPSDWELVVVDNLSATPLASHLDLSRIHNARCVREENLGHTHARIRGIHETTASLIVFVDDDNVLAPDFLAHAVRISIDRPYVGAFGGNVVGIFEVPVPNYAKSHLYSLAIREVNGDYWGNSGSPLEGPVGAGLCLRRDVAALYASEAGTSSTRTLLGRKGQSLTCGEDIDIILTAIKMGYASGNFSALKLEHLIPASRLEKDYLIRLAEGMAYSVTLLGRIHNHPQPAPASIKRRALNLLNLFLMSNFERKVAAANRRGTQRARQVALS